MTDKHCYLKGKLNTRIEPNVFLRTSWKEMGGISLFRIHLFGCAFLHAMFIEFANNTEDFGVMSEFQAHTGCSKTPSLIVVYVNLGTKHARR